MTHKIKIIGLMDKPLTRRSLVGKIKKELSNDIQPSPEIESKSLAEIDRDIEIGIKGLKIRSIKMSSLSQHDIQIINIEAGPDFIGCPIRNQIFRH